MQTRSPTDSDSQMTREATAKLKDAEREARARTGIKADRPPSRIASPLKFSDVLTPEQLAEREQQAAEREEKREQARRLNMWRDIERDVGRRYEGCRFDNFETAGPAQEKALETVRGYADDIQESLKTGRGLILYGPVGTGKDHLIVGVLHAACRASLESVKWINGPTFFAERRDDIDRGNSERQQLSPFALPALLAMSEPVGPDGTLTRFQSDWLYRLVDTRYRNMRPTLVTLNVADRREFCERLGAATADRLLHDAVTVHCKWKSYRRPEGSE